MTDLEDAREKIDIYVHTINKMEEQSRDLKQELYTAQVFLYYLYY
jgi:hypothetical protein